jgi:hypothetical protein
MKNEKCQKCEASHLLLDILPLFHLPTRICLLDIEYHNAKIWLLHREHDRALKHNDFQLHTEIHENTNTGFEAVYVILIKLIKVCFHIPHTSIDLFIYIYIYIYIYTSMCVCVCS